MPSTNTIALWTAEARAQARVLAYARDLYVLSKSFVNVAQFDREQLGVVIDATSRRMDAATGAIERRRWKSLLDSLVATRDGQPLPVPKQDFDDYLASLATDAKADLLHEADVARGMTQRFERWQQVVEDSLREVVDSLPAI
jgi:hypothetical protein